MEFNRISCGNNIEIMKKWNYGKTVWKSVHNNTRRTYSETPGSSE